MSPPTGTEPRGEEEQNLRSRTFLCRYYIRTASLKLPISGCSFQCYREVELKSCCPGFWGPDCVGEILGHVIVVQQKKSEGFLHEGAGLVSGPGIV